MTQTNKQETLAERRHRVWKGRGLCHAHAILRGVAGLCGSRETPGGPRLCEAHSKVLLDELKPTESVWINRRDLDRLRSESEQYADQRRRNRPLEDRVAELDGQSKVAGGRGDPACCPAALRLQRFACSGPWVIDRSSSSCPRSHGSCVWMSSPHRQHCTVPVATLGAHSTRSRWCLAP